LRLGISSSSLACCLRQLGVGVAQRVVAGIEHVP
jgi:hypothetical protein